MFNISIKCQVLDINFNLSQTAHLRKVSLIKFSTKWHIKHNQNGKEKNYFQLDFNSEAQNYIKCPNYLN